MWYLFFIWRQSMPNQVFNCCMCAMSFYKECLQYVMRVANESSWLERFGTGFAHNRNTKSYIPERMQGRMCQMCRKSTGISDGVAWSEVLMQKSNWTSRGVSCYYCVRKEANKHYNECANIVFVWIIYMQTMKNNSVLVSYPFLNRFDLAEFRGSFAYKSGLLKNLFWNQWIL